MATTQTQDIAQDMVILDIEDDRNVAQEESTYNYIKNYFISQ